MSSLQNQTANATRWSSITEVASRLVLPIVNMVLARLLTPDAFGVVATITMIVSFAEIFADAGFQKYIIQHSFDNQQELDQCTNVAFWTNLILSIFLWVILFIFKEPLAALVGNPGLGNVVAVASISLPMYAFSSIQMARFKRDMDFKSLFFVRMVSVLVPFFVTIPIAFFTSSYWALITGTLASNLANAIVLTIRSKWKPKLYYSFKQLKGMFLYSWWILLESVTTWLSSYSDTFIVSLSLSSYYIGLYKTSMVTVNQIMGLIVAAASGPLFVALTRLQHNRQELVSTYNEYMTSLAFLIFPLSAGIWIYKDIITMILLGNQWVEASGFIGLWGLMSSITLVFGTFANGLYNAIGKTYLSFIVSFLNLVIMVPVLLWATPKGFDCLYVSRSLLRVSFVVIQLIAMVFVLRYPVGNLLKNIVPVAIPTIIMSVCAYALRLISSTLIWSLMSVIACVGIYIVVAYLMYKKRFIQAIAMLGLLPDKFLNKFQ